MDLVRINRLAKKDFNRLTDDEIKFLQQALGKHWDEDIKLFKENQIIFDIPAMLTIAGGVFISIVVAYGFIYLCGLILKIWS